MPTPPLEERLPRIHDLLEQGRRQKLHLGGQIYVSVAGETVTNTAFGEARPGEPMSPSRLMVWLSASKPVTAVAIGQLWEQELLGLDDPVATHVPEFAAHGKDQITIRHLLTHTGGIRMLDLHWERHSWDETIATICGTKPEPRWLPGQRAGYHSFSSWFILGEIIQRASSQPFSTYVRQEIFETAGMNNCWIGMPADSYQTQADLFAPMFTTGTPTPDTPDPLEKDNQHEIRDLGLHEKTRITPPSPGGNGVGPISELGKFYEVLLAGGGALLRPQTVEALTARHRVGMMDRTFRHRLDWGLGFIPNSAHYDVETTPYGYGQRASARTFGHSGFQSSVGMADPEHRLVVALCFNGLPGDEVHRGRMDAVLDLLYEELELE